MASSIYPGSEATASQVKLLADEYRRAAEILMQQWRPGDPLSRAPYRLAAIHATELYLNALLLHRGVCPADIRGLQHDLAARAKLAVAHGLRLRDRTAAHLGDMSLKREYLVTRYGPEMTQASSQLNRLAATLEEVAGKVDRILAPSGHAAGPKPPRSPQPCGAGATT